MTAFDVGQGRLTSMSNKMPQRTEDELRTGKYVR